MKKSPTMSLLKVEDRPGKPMVLWAGGGGDPARWAAENKTKVRPFVAEHGSLLVRGLGLSSAAEAESVFRGLGNLMIETEAFTPRQRHSERVYSSSKWPPNQPMCMHHELSYAIEPPRLMLFACLQAPTKGGATPVADASAVLEALPSDLVGRFEREGWILTRNYNDEIGATLAEAFGTDDRGAIERYCRAHAIEFEWRDGGALRTRQRRRAVVLHPPTGRRCWFNQVAFLNEWTMAPELREYLVEVYGEDGLPFNTRFGNGDPVGPDIVQAINQAYDKNTVREPWQAGDLLLVDNVRTAHAREPFEGPRDVVVGLADPLRVSVC
ncbi:MAG TPA: TauD/TfdA family dioxygenase [Planctomycetota bacterium]|nr:TauD/TfdA family dioxygenase [Planctomycetota bacterium]